MNTALLFPGQGVQKVGMGKDLYEEFPVARELYDKADNLLGFNLKGLCFEGPQGELTDSKNAQPAILLHSYILFKLVKDKLDYSVVAGHSLGEFTAHLSAGTFVFEDALHLVRFRGELMSSTKNGSMSAIIGLDPEEINRVLDSIKGIVVIANFNSTDQTVISGEVDAVKEAGVLLKERGARVISLAVGGAFHSPLMESVFEPFRKVLLKTEIRKSEVLVYSNVAAVKVENPEQIRKTLAQQILKPVQWVNILKNMEKEGINRFIEIGYGNILSRLVNKTLDNVETINISSATQVRRFLENG
ncbi:ACP S-malonyltransferase [candidate division WOR-3 bacterium]|nr:ACP S-malonyltransferase [candidate division WOR-3 bacterium]